MSRPGLIQILSGAASWDTNINDNNDKLVEAPFPIHLESIIGDLTTNFPPALYDACLAVVWDGTPGNPVSLYVSNGSAWEAPVVGFSGKVLDDNNMIHISHEPSQGSNGGDTNSTVWGKRTFDTLVSNTIGASATFTAGVLTLPAGQYFVQACGQIYDSQKCRGKIENITDTAPLCYGPSGVSGTVSDQTVLIAQFTLGASKIVEFQQWVSSGKVTDGMGLNTNIAGLTEHFGYAKYWKTA